MKGIVLVTLEYPPQIGGVGRFYHRLVQLATPVQSIDVLDNNHGQLLHPWIKAGLVLWRTLRSNDYTALIIGQILPLGTVAALLSYIWPGRLIIFTHGMDVLVPQRYWRKRLLMRWIVQRADHIIAISHFTAQAIQQLVPSLPPTKISLLPPGPYITPEIITTQLIVDLPDQFMLSVGRLVERKGFDRAIAAMASLSSKHNSVHYVIAGSGVDQARLASLANTLGVSQRVHILTELTDQYIAQLYSRCLFLVQPSRALANGDVEGFGMVVLEANTFSKPAIVGNSGGMPDTVVANHTGIIVDATAVSAISAAMEQLLNQPAYCQHLGQMAARWVQQQHDWSAKVATLLKVCHDSD
ncbi:MAG: glycosyltransferase family 4 protein [Candidatus Kerfeldbacteria bacterium]|nr:glycosyltransferase family 4 protein [Candidatus Kerfeldbacteria bacterium]